MPMRSELANIPVTRQANDSSAWVVIAFCLAGLGLAFWLSIDGASFNDLPVLIVQSNLG